MKLEKQLLSKRILAMYDYPKTKKALSDWIEDTDWKRLELKRWFIPSATRNLELREEQFIPSTISKETESVDRKLDLQREIENREKSFELAFEELMPIEQTIYKKSFEQKHSCCQMACDENTYIDYINKVKQSAVIKIAVILNIAVLKTERDQK